MTEPIRHPRPTDEAGITIIELMVVLVVFAIGILSLSVAQMRSSANVYGTGRQTRALELAQDRIENIRSGGYASAVADTGQTDNFAWIVQADSVNSDLRHVAVIVSWTDNGRAQSLRLDDLVSNR